ncbi:MAG: diacylglycerol kinase family protein [Acetobacteraceae bacterium]|nr:diacylglycerol kinase family protein [Acetobacteraceae bacterium]
MGPEGAGGRSCGLGRSFGDALAGAAQIWRGQRNMRIHLAVALGAAWAGWVLGFSAMEWAVLALTVGAVMGLEALNTALETAVDLACGGRAEPLARRAKNAAAAGVLVAALAAVAVGAALFGPRLGVAGERLLFRLASQPWAMALWAAGFAAAAAFALVRIGGDSKT